ncbi:class I SAM-dependent methyltransferase [bacterium]|nr:class I SAM-dependent methyltransferase [Rhodopirellula sp.]MDB4678735.1 class I SAM-dependent methyltransferase [Rhodopirellula sp.]MDC0278889.1 class I SAM-dependent methyltransferase [bacterium]MDC0295430.1 class I SAM-dependent methyltransferase [bacterium]
MSAKDTFRQLFFRVPVIGKRYRELLAAAQSHYQINPGHYASPIPSVGEIQRELDAVSALSLNADALPGIPLNSKSQLQLLASIKLHLADYPFPPERNDSFRYHYLNDWFQLDDGAVLHALLREFRPRKIIEIGSGFSSAVILDTVDHLEDFDPDITLIEPNCERLKSRLQVGDESQIHLIESVVQDVQLSVFDQLEEKDFLFIDSSHVAKCGSDVNVIIHQILPQLNPGVIVHFHDIFFPFTYPERLLRANQFWNESYMLRSFLANNERFQVMLWNDYLKQTHTQEFQAAMPLGIQNIAASFWMRCL